MHFIRRQESGWYRGFYSSLAYAGDVFLRDKLRIPRLLIEGSQRATQQESERVDFNAPIVPAR